MPSTLFFVRLYSKSCVLQAGNYLSSYFSFVPFMLLSSCFFLIATPLRANCLLFDPPLVPSKGSFEWSFYPSSFFEHFIVRLSFSHLVCSLLLQMTPTPLGLLQLFLKFSIFFSSQLDLVNFAIQPCKCVV